VSQPNLFCFDADTGALLWSTNTGGKIQQNALAVDPTTGDVLVGMIRSAGYTQADGSAATAQAEMLRIEGSSGLLLSTFDLTDNVTFNGYIGPASMAGSYGIDVNSRGEVLVGLAPYRYDV
jgi:outer membrane protein assembly factor BamB